MCALRSAGFAAIFRPAVVMIAAPGAERPVHRKVTLGPLDLGPGLLHLQQLMVVFLVIDETVHLDAVHKRHRLLGNLSRTLLVAFPSGTGT